MKELLLSFLFALVVGSIINGLSQPAPTLDSLPAQSSTGTLSTPAEPGSVSLVTEATETSFDADVLKADGLVLVEFGAKWCQPCKMMTPILTDVAGEYSGKLRVVKVDVDENRTLSEQYAQGGLPTFVLFEGGKTKHMFVGYTAKPELVKIINSYLS